MSNKIIGDEPYFPFFSGSNGYHDCFDLHGNGNHFISFNSGITIRQKFIMDYMREAVVKENSPHDPTNWSRIQQEALHAFDWYLATINEPQP